MKKLAENMRKLRVGSGETQKELGNLVGKASNTIAMYEIKERCPDIETVQWIARHYGVLIDSLLSTDIQENDFKWSNLTWEKLEKGFEILFPVVHIDEEIQGPHFAKGYEKTLEILNAFKNPEGLIDTNIIAEAANEYALAVQNQSNNLECLANLLWIIFVCYVVIADEYYEIIGKAILDGDVIKKDFYKKYILKDPNPKTQKINECKRKFIEDIQEIFMDLICTLRSNQGYDEFADYYLALRYTIGLIDNGYEDELNKVIGLEMMCNYAKMGNQYAVNLIKYGRGFCTSKTSQ